MQRTCCFSANKGRGACENYKKSAFCIETMEKQSVNQPSAADKIYATPQGHVDPFEFNEDVVAVFPDMIKRSVPGYESVLDMMTVLAGEFVTSGSVAYDLGCSLGATTRAIINGLDTSEGGFSCRVVAVDNAPAMINYCQQNRITPIPGVSLEYNLADIRNIPVQYASLVALNYTLQFIPVDHRLALLRSIYEGMLPGGALVLSEKITLDASQEQQTMTELHHAFKRLNGYSDLEISQKRTALENVLVPESITKHKDRLHEAGFTSCMVWFQSFNFVSMLALK